MTLEMIEKHHPAFEEIVKYFDRNGFEAADRTIQRDIQYSARIMGSTLSTATTRRYLVGIRDDVQELRIFGIDRINRLEISNKTFEPRRGFNPLDMIRHTIGINSTESKPEQVELSFSPLQGKYVKGLPWHHSQKILVDNDEEMRIELYVNPQP